MRRLFSVASLISATFVAASGTAVLATQATAAEIEHQAVVSEDPVDYTPHVLEGRVRAIAVVGETVVVGGEFSQVKEANGTNGANAVVRRSNLFAFDARTGQLKSSFTPRLDGPVLALAAGPSGTIYVGGGFKHVNGTSQRGLAQLHLSTGSRVGTLAGADLSSGIINSLASHGDHLYVAGRFSRIGGTAHTGIARVNTSTGRVDPRFSLSVAEANKGTTSVKDLALNSSGTRLVIDGNFNRVGGQTRHQLAVIDTSGRTPRLMNWATEAYAEPCTSGFHTYLREVDFSPDGSYFVIVTAGGPRGPETLCDTVARWETSARGSNIEPTWVNRTGGDSLYSVEATGAAVYVGGHQRWMNNAQATGEAGPGAVTRKGIAAVDPVTGRALAWNPTRARGHGVEAMVATPYGLFVGSDTERLGHEYHARIGMFPLPGKTPPGKDAPDNPKSPESPDNTGERPDKKPRPDKPDTGQQPDGPQGDKPNAPQNPKPDSPDTDRDAWRPDPQGWNEFWDMAPWRRFMTDN